MHRLTSGFLLCNRLGQNIDPIKKFSRNSHLCKKAHDLKKKWGALLELRRFTGMALHIVISLDLANYIGKSSRYESNIAKN